MVSLIDCNASGRIAPSWWPVALRGNTDSGLFDRLPSFAHSPLDEHDFTTPTALQALDFWKPILFGKSSAKPKAGEASTPRAHRTQDQISWTKHKSLRFLLKFRPAVSRGRCLRSMPSRTRILYSRARQLRLLTLPMASLHSSPARFPPSSFEDRPTEQAEHSKAPCSAGCGMIGARTFSLRCKRYSDSWPSPVTSSCVRE